MLRPAAGVFGTLAYLTGTDTVNNTFTVGNVKITLDEAKVNTDGTPVVGADRVKTNEYHLLPGHTYTKDPTVTVKTGSDASYVRMKVTFNNAKAIIALCTDPEFAEDGPTGTENAYPLIRMVKFVEANAAKWDGIIPDNMVETEEMLADAKYFAYDAKADTLTYYFYYNETVAAPTADVALPVLFNEVTLPEWSPTTSWPLWRISRSPWWPRPFRPTASPMPAPLGPPSTADFPPVSTAHGLRPTPQK